MSDTTWHPTYRIMDMHEGERPRERLAALGAQALTPAELIAILLRVGVRGENAVQLGERLLQKFGGLEGLHQAPLDLLTSERGVGAAKATQIKAAIELGRRLTLEAPDQRPVINCPDDVADQVRYEMAGLEEEHLRVLLLDTRNHVLASPEIYRGSVNTSQVRVGEVFKAAVRRNATAVILVHNHPSGDPTPSPDDVAVTRACIEAGKLLDIAVLDHLVIGRSRYVSMKERGLAFESGS